MATFLEKALDPLKYFFWKAQIRVLRACPPLGDFVIRRHADAMNSRKVWVKILFRLVLRMPGMVCRHWRNQRENRVELPRVSILVTTRCTLRCDKCQAHIPDLKSRRDMPTNDLIHDIRSLLSCVDYIYGVVFTGGEAFLHPDFDQIIRVCGASDKVDYLCVATNGTVIPDAKLLAALREAKVKVFISGYPPALQPDVEKLKLLLEENGIFYSHDSRASWYDLGDFGQLQAGPEKRRFRVCSQQASCLPYLNGKLHLCTESALLMEEGLIPDCKADYIDVRAACAAAFRGQWRALLKRRAVSACAYCLGCTYKTPRVPVAMQRGPSGGN